LSLIKVIRKANCGSSGSSPNVIALTTETGGIKVVVKHTVNAGSTSPAKHLCSADWVEESGWCQSDHHLCWTSFYQQRDKGASPTHAPWSL